MSIGSHGTSLEVGEIPLTLGADWVSALPYYQTASSIIPITEKSEDNDMQAEIMETIHHLSTFPNSEIRRRADQGDAAAVIDHGLRLIVGYKCAKNEITASQYFDRVLGGLTDDPQLTAKAHICKAITLVDVQAWQQGIYAPTERQAFAAGYHYNEAAKLGFGKCPALLYFVQALAPQRQQLKSMQYWSAMWAVYEARNEEMDAESRKAAEKLAKKPNRYVCAAEDCGIAANTGKVLLRCAGKCSDEYKPSYCSKDCQKKDWKRHKLYCAANKPPPPTPLPVHAPGKSEKGVRSISIPHPSGQGMLQVSSSTVGVDVLKAIQEMSLERQ